MNKIGEAYTENHIGIGGTCPRSAGIAPINIRSDWRGLQRHRSPSKAIDMVRLWRVSEVFKLWHVRRDALST